MNFQKTETRPEVVKGRQRPGASKRNLLFARVKLLLVDDNREFLGSVVRFLAGYPELEVVAAAVSAREALDQIEVLRPDVVLLDIVMPKMDGLEATKLLKSSPLSLKVVIWTLHTDSQYRMAAIEAGADGFVVKSQLGKELLPLIRRIAGSG